MTSIAKEKFNRSQIAVDPASRLPFQYCGPNGHVQLRTSLPSCGEDRISAGNRRAGKISGSFSRCKLQVKKADWNIPMTDKQEGLGREVSLIQGRHNLGKEYSKDEMEAKKRELEEKARLRRLERSGSSSQQLPPAIDPTPIQQPVPIDEPVASPPAAKKPALPPKKDAPKLVPKLAAKEGFGSSHCKGQS